METQSAEHLRKHAKSQHVKSKYNRRTEQASNSVKEQPLLHRRVFGTVRRTNLPDKVAPEKPKWQKPSLKPTLTTPPPKEPTNKTASKQKKVPTKPSLKPAQQVQTTPPVSKEVSKTNKPKKKKSVSFLEGGEGSRTPYQTAEKCSKCRFDKMETASYWLAQVRLAESVGKHFVSAGLFKFALESKAEPIRSLRVELNRYVLRHRYLSVEAEWNNLTASYGLNITPNDQVEVEAREENGGDLDQACNESTKQFTDQLESTLKI